MLRSASHLIVCIRNRWSLTEIPLFVNTPALVIKCSYMFSPAFLLFSPFLSAHTFPQTPVLLSDSGPAQSRLMSPSPNHATATLQCISSRRLLKRTPGVQTETPDLVVRGASYKQEAPIAHQEMPPPISWALEMKCYRRGKANPNAAMKTVTDSLTSIPFY